MSSVRQLLRSMKVSLVCTEERTRDVNFGDVTSLVGIDGGSDHNAVSGNCGGAPSSFLYLG